MKKIIKSLFCSGDEFNPTYMWITILMSLLIVTFILKLTEAGARRISDTMFIGLLGFVVTWLTIYNYRRIKDNGNSKETSVENRPDSGGSALGGIVDSARDIISGAKK